MPRVITATLTQCAQGKPMAVLENLPRDRAELRPSDLRRLARLKQGKAEAKALRDAERQRWTAAQITLI